MKRIFAAMLVSVVMIQGLEINAMSSVEAFKNWAREKVTQSKGLQAAVKFVQGKPLTDEERTILKKATIGATFIAIVAAVTGLSTLYTKNRLSNIEKFAQKQAFDPKKADVQAILKIAENEKISLQEGPFGMGNKTFIRAIIENDDDVMKAFYCNQKNDVLNVDLNAAEFGLKYASTRRYELGVLVAEYIINRIKAQDENDDLALRTPAVIKARRLGETIEKTYGVVCRN